MFRHHEQDKAGDATPAVAPGSTGRVRDAAHRGPISDVEREKLLAEGKEAKAMVWSITPLEGQPGVTHLRVEAHFSDGQRTQFGEDLPSLYQPEPDSPDGVRIRELRQRLQLKHAEHMPKLQLETTSGSNVTVRYDESDRNRMVVDLPALQKKAVGAYIAAMTKPKHDQPETAPPTGPPWDVPDHCPNCGAPVDVAVATKAQDPQCRFCEQPLPVKPLARR
jgi:hypothetical protein